MKTDNSDGAYSQWQESLHPRHPSGNAQGGEFAPKTWGGLEHEIKTNTRFGFIAKFVAKQTETKVNREVTNGYQVRREGSGWSYGQVTGRSFTKLSGPHSADALHDVIRRTPLNHYVREAEDLRFDVLGGTK